MKKSLDHHDHKVFFLRELRGFAVFFMNYKGLENYSSRHVLFIARSRFQIHSDKDCNRN